MAEDRRIRHSKERIRKAMLECLKTTSLDKVTVRQICDAADINRSTFYAHYSDPLTLYRQIESEFIEGLNSGLAEFYGSSISYKTLLKENLKYFSLNSDEVLALMRTSSPSLKATILRLHERYDLSAIVRDDEQSYWLEFYVSGMFSIITRWLEEGCRRNAEEMVDLLFRITNNLTVKSQ